MTDPDTSLPANPPPQPGSRLPPLVTCIVAILLSGMMTGYLQGRWQPSENLQEVGSRLNELPAKLGNWELASEGKLEDQAQELLQCHGSIVREYWNPTTGDRVNLAILFGPRGPIAVHTPEVCYSSRGTQPVGTREAVSIAHEGQQDQFWKIQFRTVDAESPHLEVWYGWSDGGPWHAAKVPRVWFTNHLYKIQVAGPPPQAGESSPTADFMQALLPILHEDFFKSGE